MTEKTVADLQDEADERLAEYADYLLYKMKNEARLDQGDNNAQKIERSKTF